MINICSCTCVNHSSKPHILMITQKMIYIVLLVLLCIKLILISCVGNNFVDLCGNLRDFKRLY